MKITKSYFALGSFISLLLVIPSGFISAQVFERDLYFGVQNDADVTKLQEFLTDQSIYSGPITGNFFSLTLRAVKNFQLKERIIPSAGYFGPRTRARINKILSEVLTESQQQALIETGTASPPAMQSPTQNNSIGSLTEQIKLLQAQIVLLQQKIQSTPTTTPSGTIPAIPATPPVPTAGTGTPAIPATPAQPSQNTPPTTPPPPPPPPPPPSPPPPPPSPTVSFSATPESITVGQQPTLSWFSQNTSSCTASNGWTGSKAISGTQIVSPVVTTTYTITCTGQYGSAFRQVTVTVSLPAAPAAATCVGILCENFNSYANGLIVNQGWTNRANGGPYVIQDMASTTGDKVLSNFNTGADSVITKTGNTVLMDGKQAFWVYTVNRANWGSYNLGENVQIRISKGSWDSSVYTVMAFMKDGHVAYIDPRPDKFVSFDTYNDNAWNLAEIEWKSSDQLARFRVNSGSWSDWIPLKWHWEVVDRSSASGFDTVGFVTFYLGTGGVYFDNSY